MYPRNLSQLALLTVPLLAYVSSIALGMPQDREQPIQLEADRAELDQKTGVSVYQGNVVITQGSMRLAADKATVFTDNGVFQRIEAMGQPVTWRYKPADDKDELFGTSQRMEYDASKNTIIMTKSAKVIQNKDVFTGDRIDYDLTADLVKARGEDGRRIQITIQPRQLNVQQPEQ
jgi:lipopolysaccharide export system protein LptA